MDGVDARVQHQLIRAQDDRHGGKGHDDDNR